MIRLPWSAWLDERERALPLPPGWTIDVAAPAGRPEGPGLEEALHVPVAGPSLVQLAHGAASVAIAVEDITRPSALARPLERMLDLLRRGGIAPRKVTVIVACGAHAPLRLPELKLKLGPRVLAECDVRNHSPYDDLVDLGTSAHGLPVRLNRAFLEADLRLAVGSVMPHPYAGFGGGGKIVLPGLAAIETLEMNHRPAVTGLAGAGLGIVEGNRARAEMDDIARLAGLAAVLNIVPGPRREPLGFFFGEPVAAHRAAVAHARQVLAAPLRPGADAVLLNAYPKDGEILQAGNAFNAWRGCAVPLARPGGTVVVSAACPWGRGWHGLHGPGMRLYRAPGPRPYLEDRPLVVFAPSLSEADVRVSFWEGYPHAREWDDVVAHLRRHHPGGGRMLVVPCAPLVLPVVTGAAAHRPASAAPAEGRP